MVLFALVGSIGLYSAFAATADAKSCDKNSSDCLYISKQGHISRLYKGTLGHYPDKAGLDYWSDRYGASIEESGQHILTHCQCASYDKDQFIKHMYEKLLSRQPKTNEYEYYRTTLGTNTNAEKARAVATLSKDGEVRGVIEPAIATSLREYYFPSAPAAAAPVVLSNVATNKLMKDCGADHGCIYDTREGHVSRMYQGIFRQPGDKAGIQYWVGQYSTTSNAIGVHLLNADNADSRYMKNSAAGDFIINVYAKYLDRAPAEAEKSYWMQQLGAAATNDRAKLLLHFSGQQEVKQNQQSKIASKLLEYFTQAGIAPRPAPIVTSGHAENNHADETAHSDDGDNQATKDVINDLAGLPQDLATSIKNELRSSVSYFVIPHPDDELSGWSLIQESKFPVFILMTQGETSYFCNNYGGKGSQQCKDKRVSSWHIFLDNYYSVGKKISKGNYSLYIGSNSARLVFDAGDRDLSLNEVHDAISHARGLGLGSGLTEGYVISTGQHYDHPDHKAVRAAVEANGYPKRLARNGPLDPTAHFYAVINDNGITDCPGGTFNIAHGWLRPPCWQIENSDFMSNNAFVRVQPYVRF